MSKITMSREALECRLAEIEDRVSKTTTILVLTKTFHDDVLLDDKDSFMMTEALEMADEQLALAMSSIDLLKADAGIEAEAQVAA